MVNGIRTIILIEKHYIKHLFSKLIGAHFVEALSDFEVSDHSMIVICRNALQNINATSL